MTGNRIMKAREISCLLATCLTILLSGDAWASDLPASEKALSPCDARQMRSLTADILKKGLAKASRPLLRRALADTVWFNDQLVERETAIDSIVSLVEAAPLAGDDAVSGYSGPDRSVHQMSADSASAELFVFGNREAIGHREGATHLRFGEFAFRWNLSNGSYRIWKVTITDYPAGL
jgi:hypothetical protein